MSSWLQNLDPVTLRDCEREIERVSLGAGEILFNQGDPGGAMYVVVTGTLQVVGIHDDGSETILGEMEPEDTIGEVQALTGGTRTATIRAVTDCELDKLSQQVFNRITEQSPDMLDEMMGRARRRLNRNLLAAALPELFGPLDREILDFLKSEESDMEWVRIHRGEELFQQGDTGDDLYIVLSGRLSAIVTDETGQERLLGEISRGECIGEMAFLTGSPRISTVRAVRDSLLVAFSKESFQKITDRFPGVLFNVARILVDRLVKSTPALAAAPSTAGSARTVAILPADGNVAISEFARRLTAALSLSGATLHLSREHTDVTARDPDSEVAETRLAEWLDSQELRFRFLVYEAEPTATPWTRRCLRQADQILLMTQAGAKLDTARLQQLLGGTVDDLRDRTTLVILHPDDPRRPQGTARLLSDLGLHRHHHLRMDRPGECKRLARFLEGRAVGLTLGGGGARGFTHIGVIRALREAGIPIDMIGGTSMGSLIAAQYALDGDAEAALEMNRKLFLEGKPQRDFTLPIFSVLSTRRSEKLMGELFQNIDIEDLWLNYFAISANLSRAQQVVHQSGSVIKAVSASTAVPGAVTPVLDGHELLVDGGLLNNLPGDVMRRLCGGSVILVNVSPQNDLRVGEAGDHLPSPWRVMWSRMNPLMKKMEVPGLFDIVLRSSLLASTQNAAAAKRQADFFLEPPIAGYGLFDLSELETLVDVGYRYAIEKMDEWTGPRES